MNLLLSDTSLPHNLPDNPNSHYTDLSKMKVKSCMGCFGCWVKTPGRCVIRDDAVKIYPLVARSENIIYVSRLFYGSYGEPMKAMMERSIPAQQAFIRLYNGETHHVQRAVAEKRATVIAYGDTPQPEQEIFRKLVVRNARNMMFSEWKIYFSAEENVEKIVLAEVASWENC